MNSGARIEGDNSAVGSDDEISVIAVIKKGTSGIPKRARYHYIRELPLISVKSLKKPSILQKGIGDLETSSLPTTRATTTTTSTSEAKKRPRVIELSDVVSKMELRRQFKIPDKDNDDDEGSVSSALGRPGSDNSLLHSGKEIVHKLPPGTVLIKQENRTDPFDAGIPGTVFTNASGGSGTGATTATTTTTTTENSSNNSSASSSSNSSSSSSSSVSSFGSGSGSGSCSPSAKVKRLHRGSKSGGANKVLDVIPRRNPKRCSSKKQGCGGRAETAITTTMTTTTTLTTTTTTRRPRERQRLLATKRQEKNETVTESVGISNTRTRSASTMPYMNTRSVTRKLYTVGATYQAPTRKDEMEWREWPVHGMHERPVFHPRIGLATGYAGRIFWATSDVDGLNWKYREVLDGGEEVEVVSVDPESKGIGDPRSPFGASSGVNSDSESFEVCMHESLHCVLAYCAQIMAPGYPRSVGKKRRFGGDVSLAEELTDAAAAPRSQNSGNPGLPELEDSAISDETLMEMSSIYKKLLPAEDQPPSSHENSAPSSTRASPLPGNKNKNNVIKTIIDGGSPARKNPSEASEIARILSEYNESLKESKPGSLPVQRSSEDVNSFAPTAGGDGRTTFGEGEPLQPKIETISTTSERLQTPEKQNCDGKWLEELLVDTSLLYCVANGVDQRDLTRYVDSLDSKQSLKWLRRRDG